MTDVSSFHLLAAILGQIGRYQLHIKEQRSIGAPSVRFNPYVPRVSQAKRRLNARRLGRY